MTLRLYVPNTNRMLRELSDLEQLSNALFSPANWGRDITSRETASALAPVRQTPEGDYKMELYVDVHKFTPSEVSVSTKDGRLTVEGTSERKNEDGSFYSQSHFKRVFPIPAGVDKEKMTAKFTAEGGLLLEAPAAPPKPSVDNGPASLPITHQ